MRYRSRIWTVPEQKLSFTISEIDTQGDSSCSLAFILLERQLQHFDTYHFPDSSELHKCLTVVLYQTYRFHNRPKFLPNTIDHFS